MAGSLAERNQIPDKVGVTTSDVSRNRDPGRPGDFEVRDFLTVYAHAEFGALCDYMETLKVNLPVVASL